MKAINGDPFIGMFETPVTSSPGVTMLLSNLPAYRTGVSPLLRGVEIGLTHGFFLTGPFIKLGPLRATEAAEVAGCLSGAGLVLILTACLSIYGAVSFQQPSVVGVKTLTGRSIARDPLQTSEGWAQFSSGWLVGGLSGVAWAYILTQSASPRCRSHAGTSDAAPPQFCRTTRKRYGLHSWPGHSSQTQLAARAAKCDHTTDVVIR